MALKCQLKRKEKKKHFQAQRVDRSERLES